MLSPLRLRDSLRHIYDPQTMPSATQAVSEWVRSYVVYANDAVAGVTKLVSPLVPQDSPGDFLVALDGALRSTWMTASWVGPAATGVTTLVPPVAPFLMQNAALLISSFDRESALAAIAQSIHTYTLSITVTVTTATGVTSVVPLV